MYSPEQKSKAVQLRLSGKSYGEIQKLLNIPSKGTLSVWFRKLVLPPEAKRRLAGNIEKATRRKLLAFNERRTERIKKENSEARERGRKSIGSLSKRDLLILGAALYWGEGTKSEGNRSYNPVAFTNSDPEMIRMFMRFIREVLMIPDDKITGGLRIYSNINERAARNFWAKCTGLPAKRFYVSYQASKAGKGIRKTLPFGTLSVRIQNRPLFFEVKGLVEGLAAR